MLAACGDAAQLPAQAPPEVEVSQPVVRSIREWDEYTGRFEPVDRVEIRARVGGFLESVRFREGSIVKKGDELFIIDPRPFQATIDRVTAEVMSAQAAVDGAARELERARRLRETSAGSQQALDDRLTAKLAADAALLSAKANLRLAQLDLEFATVKAPIAGRISEAQVTAGNLIAGGQSNATLLATIVSITPMRFAFDISEAAALKYLRLASAGGRPTSRDNPNRVQVRLFDESEWTREGHMEFVNNAIDEQTGTIRERAIFDNTDDFLIPGAFGRLRVIASNEYEAILLPDAAIGTDQARKIVAVVGADNTVAMKVVELGPLHDGLRIIRKGINRDDRVVVNGLMRVRPGSAVTPKAVQIADAAP
jgi:RND family efflux transporter MFP subunit